MNQSYYDSDYKETNRDKVKRPLRVRTWCENCDRELVAEHSKCPICHMRQKYPRKRRFRK